MSLDDLLVCLEFSFCADEFVTAFIFERVRHLFFDDGPVSLPYALVRRHVATVVRQFLVSLSLRIMC